MPSIRRRPTLFAVSAMLFFSITATSYASDNEVPNPMDKLSWLLGNWTFEDAQVNGAYWERGTRDCVKVLDDQYIRCESIGTSNSGNERSYYFILGYNRMDERYEMVGLTSSYPRQNLYIITPSEDGHVLELRNHFWTTDGITPKTRYFIRLFIRDRQTAIWKNRRCNFKIG